MNHLFQFQTLRGLSTRSKALIGIGLILVVVVVGWIVHRSRAPQASPVQAEATRPAPKGGFVPTKSQFDELTIVTVAPASFRGEQLTDGTIAANDDATTPVFSPYSGRVVKLYAKLGDVVSKGTPLMSIEASEFVQGQNDLAGGLAAADSARAQVKLAVAAEQRQHELYLAKGGALKDWLQSQADLATAQNALRTAEIALDASRNRLRILGKSDAEIDQLQTGPAHRAMSPEAIVRSPIAGTILQRQLGAGQYIQSAAAGASMPVFVVGNLSTVWLIANVRETEAAQLQVGQPVEVRVPAWPGRVFKARISWIASALDANTHRLSVRADVDNRDGALKPMMFASFQIVTGAAVSAPAVPQEAVVYEGADAHVFVAADDGSLMVRPIHVGRTSGAMVEVLDGIAAGEKVVTRGALFIDRATETK